MERRGCGMGCVITLLGLVLSCCLLPYFVSSVYSVVSAVLQVEGAPNWLWGDWLSSVVGADSALYMLLAEGPICCVGMLGLFVVVLGAVMLIGGVGPDEPELDDGWDDGEFFDQEFYDEDDWDDEADYYEDEPTDVWDD